MNTEKVIRKWQTIMVCNLAAGLVLLSAGILFRILDINIIQNNKAIIGLSFIPLVSGLYALFYVSSIKRSPKTMKAVIVSESDERLTYIRNESDAKAFRVLRWSLTLAFFGYTLMVPSDIFEATGWWILLVFFFISQFLPAIFYIVESGKNIESEE